MKYERKSFRLKVFRDVIRSNHLRSPKLLTGEQNSIIRKLFVLRLSSYYFAYEEYSDFTKQLHEVVNRISFVKLMKINEAC